jgi:hypothetical protein
MRCGSRTAARSPGSAPAAASGRQGAAAAHPRRLLGGRDGRRRGALWLSQSSERLLCVDPASNRVDATLALFGVGTRRDGPRGVDGVLLERG